MNQNCTNTVCGSGGGSSFVKPNYENLEHDLTNVNISDLSILPNPNNGNFVINWTNEIAQDGHLQLFDINGRTIFQKEITSTNGFNSITINQKLNGGIYFIVLSNANEINRQQFIVLE